MLKLNCDMLLLTSAFKNKLRRYSKAVQATGGKAEFVALDLGRGG